MGHDKLVEPLNLRRVCYDAGKCREDRACPAERALPQAPFTAQLVRDDAGCDRRHRGNSLTCGKQASEELR